MAKSLVASIVESGSSEEASFLSALYPKDYQKKKQLSEIAAPLVPTFTLLGTIQRRFKSVVLKTYDEEYLDRQRSKDRQGLGELIEVTLGIRQGVGYHPERED